MRIPVLILAAALLPAACLAATTIPGGESRAFTHELKTGDIAEECLRLAAGKSRRFSWTASQPVDFNIHYHQGEKVSYPVKLSGQKKGAGIFTASATEDYCWMWTAKVPATITGTLDPEQ